MSKKPFIEKIFVSPNAGADMAEVRTIEAIVDAGLQGDRYKKKTGYWTAVDECQVTMIRGEDLEEVSKTTNIKILDGQHRRNIVTRNIEYEWLIGKHFRIGKKAMFVYEKPRPPCAYIESITEKGMTKALARIGGICIQVVESGIIAVDDKIII